MESRILSALPGYEEVQFGCWADGALAIAIRLIGAGDRVCPARNMPGEDLIGVIARLLVESNAVASIVDDLIPVACPLRLYHL